MDKITRGQYDKEPLSAIEPMFRSDILEDREKGKRISLVIISILLRVNPHARCSAKMLVDILENPEKLPEVLELLEIPQNYMSQMDIDSMMNSSNILYIQGVPSLNNAPRENSPLNSSKIQNEWNIGNSGSSIRIQGIHYSI